MATMAIDIGTTHCKVAIVTQEGRMHHYVSVPTKVTRTSDGFAYYEPDGLWRALLELMKEACIESDYSIDLISVAGMAEAGLYVDTRTKLPVTHIIPWFDMRTVSTYTRMQSQTDDYERFSRTGLRNHYKYGVYKMQWLLENSNLEPNYLIWLSVPDYIVFCLSGEFATDFSLAARTYVYDIFEKRYITEYISRAGLTGIALPEVVDSGMAVGKVRPLVLQLKGLESISPRALVAIAGHDHPCGSMAVGTIASGSMYDSLGTAETLMGTIELDTIGALEYESGFSFGRNITGENFYWLGSTAASGGSVEWAKQVFCTESLSYAELMSILYTVETGPTGIIYLPYLSGSNMPYSDPSMAGAFIGLRKSHGKADLLKAVLEGISFEMEWIRKRAYDYFTYDAPVIRCVGGGTRNSYWMQIKANICGRSMQCCQIEEATLLGAAWIGMLKTRNDFSVPKLIDLSCQFSATTYTPDQVAHAAYQELFRSKYLPLQESLHVIMGSSGGESVQRAPHLHDKE